jgi:hypothetical protein
MNTGLFAKIVVAVLGMAALISLNVVALRKRQAPKPPAVEPTKSFSNPAFKEYEERLGREINILKHETAEETLDRLSVPDMYFWPGPPGEIRLVGYEFPFPPWFGDRDIEQLMSNRRLLKAYQYLASLPKATAAEVVRHQIEKGNTAYDRLLQEYIRENGRFFPPDAKNPAGPGFIVGNTDQPTVVGARLRILSLVFLAGNLQLADVGPSVRAVSKQAMEQYDKFRLSREYHLYFRFRLVANAGLYNRQALAVGLIGTATKQNDPVITKYRRSLQQKRLTHFDARVTPYDQQAMLGTVQVDYPAEPLELRYLNEVSDSDLQALMEASCKR